jgi:hypothetical protein
MTVNEMIDELVILRDRGWGERPVVLSSDEEGNSFGYATSFSNEDLLFDEVDCAVLSTDDAAESGLDDLVPVVALWP